MQRKQIIRSIYLLCILAIAFLISGCNTRSGSKSSNAMKISERSRIKDSGKADKSNQSTKQPNKQTNKQSKEDSSSGTSNKLWGNSSNTDLWSGSSNTDQWADSNETEQWADTSDTELWADNDTTDLWTDSTDTEQWAYSNETELWSDTSNTELWADNGNTDLWGNSNKTANTETNSRNKGSSSNDIEKLYGLWNIWIPGGAINWYDSDTGEYATHDYQPGSGAGTIKIHKNGTYSMSHDVWDKGEIVEGKWRRTESGEINGEDAQGIVLINGIGDIDWAVVPSSNNKIRLLYESEMTAGSTLWFFDSELFQ